MKRVFIVMLAAAANIVCYGQNDPSKAQGEAFFASPWVWIIGVASFILLLVALMAGGRGKKED